jgi:hypothetical protein
VTSCGSLETEVWSAWRVVLARATGVFLKVSMAISRKLEKISPIPGELGFAATIFAHSFGDRCFAYRLYMLCTGDVLLLSVSARSVRWLRVGYIRDVSWIVLLVCTGRGFLLVIWFRIDAPMCCSALITDPPIVNVLYPSGLFCLDSSVAMMNKFSRSLCVSIGLLSPLVTGTFMIILLV